MKTANSPSPDRDYLSLEGELISDLPRTLAAEWDNMTGPERIAELDRSWKMLQGVIEEWISEGCTGMLSIRRQTIRQSPVLLAARQQAFQQTAKQMEQDARKKPRKKPRKQRPA